MTLTTCNVTFLNEKDIQMRKKEGGTSFQSMRFDWVAKCAL